MIRAWLLILAFLGLVVACGQQPDGGGLRGTVRIDGSSTMYPISEAIAEEYLAVQPNVRVTVGVSGTGGGFKKLLAGETEINNASRMITRAELAALEAAGKRILELPIAYDGLSVVVNANNDWVDYLSLDELNSIWQSGSQIKTWQDIREGWPDEQIELYAPGADSGTFDYFTARVNGSSQSSRSDFSASEDDNLLVQGIAGDRFALGYFGFVYYFENRDLVRLVPVDAGLGPVAPSAKTISSGSYSPLTRPVFLYVSETALARPEVAEFVDFYLQNVSQLLPEVGYFELPELEQEAVRLKYKKRAWMTPTTMDADVVSSSERG